ncbi:hypothetical protein T07_8436 [Trichinella nelsoni]|uniref:Uncharacterized protein n=1 Tax=Trichinella nelsoni TaxID=6336 RepID=A0A0V0RAU4_9BILA|nr:hypothetical protein T07_8436 [Trichinella nelsoni]
MRTLKAEEGKARLARTSKGNRVKIPEPGRGG